MNKLTVILNDYAVNVKSMISYSKSDIKKVVDLWENIDERITSLHALVPFKGYERWSELTPNHYRILVTRSLNTLSKLPLNDRTNNVFPEVAQTNFLILAFILCIESATFSEVEHFRINRFDDLNVTFDYSATFEVEYARPRPKEGTTVPVPEPDFSIVIDNSNEDE